MQSCEIVQCFNMFQNEMRNETIDGIKNTNADLQKSQSHSSVLSIPMKLWTVNFHKKKYFTFL